MLTNTTLSANSAQSGGGIYNRNSSPTVLDISNSIADPQFVDADGRDNIPGTSDDDLRLQFASPSIDAGDDVFTDTHITITGTTVSRRVVLHTGVISDGGRMLTGLYSETLWGLTLDPLVMFGDFEPIRPSNKPMIYLPIILRNH